MVSRAILNGWPLVPPSRRAGVAQNILAPTISGTFTVGQVLTLSNGSWIGFPSLQYSVQWLRNGLPIDGATGSTYTLVDADAATQISAVVIASNPYGNVSATTAVSTVSQGGGSPPTPGYSFLQGKQADGSYVNLSGLNADASRSTLQGKAA